MNSELDGIRDPYPVGPLRPLEMGSGDGGGHDRGGPEHGLALAVGVEFEHESDLG